MKLSETVDKKSRDIIVLIESEWGIYPVSDLNNCLVPVRRQPMHAHVLSIRLYFNYSFCDIQVFVEEHVELEKLRPFCLSASMC